MVSTDRLMESTCRDELLIVHDEQRGFHKGNNIMATDGHSKGSKGYLKDQVRINLIENQLR